MIKQRLKTINNRIPFPLLFFFSAQLMDGIAKSTITPILPIYIRNLGFSVTELGIIAAGSGVALMIFEPIWGMLADKIGPKKIFTLSILFAPLIMVSYTLVRDLVTFISLMFFSGVWGCACGVSSRMLVRLAIPKGGRAFGSWFMIFTASGLIGPITGGYVATINYSLVFYVASVIALVAFFLSFGAPKHISTNFANTEDKPKSLAKEEKTTLFTTSFLIILPMFLLFAYRTFMPVFAKEELLLSSIEIGFIFTIMSGVGVFASFLFGELSDRIGRKKIIIAGMALHGVSFVLLPMAYNPMILAFTAVVLGLGVATTSPQMMALLMEKIPISKRGLALGLYGSGEDVGLLAGPLAVGYIYQNYGAEFSFYMTAGLMLFNIIIAAFLLTNIKAN